MTWKDALKEGQELVLATSSKDGKPHAIFVICKGIVDDKILISVCQMKKSLKNIRENPDVVLITKYNNEYYRISGKGTIHASGKYFDLAIARNIKGTPKPKAALAVDINEVYDVDKVKKIK
jgi:uncharacterized pyridoxamine 5'-phosphate oxidase family protein